MSEVKWTEEQLQAIKNNGNNILVAAAAGSGKTAVLVERIINKVINENIDIDKLLIVTFTNAAASEMRQRILEAIYKEIDKDPTNIRLQKQITLLGKSNICTIHSFCLDVIKNNFYEIDASANFRIGDTTEIELLKQEVLEELFEKKYIEIENQSDNDDKESEFFKLLNTYTTYKADEPLKELILDIYKFIQSSPFPEEWIKEKAQMFKIENIKTDFAKTKWGKILLQEFADELYENILKLKMVKNNLEKYIELEKFSNTISTDIDKLEEIQNAIKLEENNINNDINNDIWNEIYNLCFELKFDKWPIDKKCTIDYKNEAKEIRDNIKKKITNLISKIFIYNSEEANKDINSMYDKIYALKDIIIEFSKNYSNAKKERNIIDFNDIEHFALRILTKEENGQIIPSEIAKKYKEKFNEIAIDEYQDSNLVQEYILNSISNGKNIFMVGDVKQSIYKFRQARPELFLKKYQKYSKELLKDTINIPGQKIQLFKNFRSRKNILDLTNLVFESLMSKKLGDINYNEEEYLNLGADYRQPISENIEEKNINQNYAGITQLHIIDLAKKENNEDYYLKNNSQIEENKNEDEDEFQNDENNEQSPQEEQQIIESTLLEADFVANKIKELLNNNYMIYDRKKDKYRKIKYKDIVILLRTTSNIAPIYEKKLQELDIPVFSDSSAEYLDSVEIQTIMSILKIINNPLQDIPLVTVLRSSIGNLTDNDLVEIRLADKSTSFYTALIKSRVSLKQELRKKVDVFLNNLEKWKQQEKIKPLNELIWQIYIDTNYYNYVGLLPNGKLKQENLKMLFERAKQYETASFKGLFNFINFIDRLKTNSTDMSAAKIIGENEDVVRIMSIHKSKGLEFPVVFLCQTGKQFNMQDLNKNILLHQDIGFGPNYIDYKRKIQYNTLAKEAIKIKLKQELISEEMRVLYVALTRAKERLFITGTTKDFQKSIKEKENILEIYKNSNKLNTSILKKYISYLDWFELIYLNNKNIINNNNDKQNIDNIIKIYNHNIFLQNDENKNQDQDKDDKNNKEFKVQEDVENKIYDILKEKEFGKENINFETYKYIEATTIPSKTTVSKIKQEKQEWSIGTGDFDHKLSKKDVPIDHNFKIPNYIQEQKITNAHKGTLIHLCIKNLNENEEYDLNKVEGLKQQLLQKEIITKSEYDAININTILNYTKSGLWKDLKQAKQIHKEEPFYINISANKIYECSENITEKILVQGIIDLYYINKDDEIILVDYKTDYIEEGNEKILIQKYKEQLELYKIALEKSLNKKVDEVIIYSIYLQKKIIIEN